METTYLLTNQIQQIAYLYSHGLKEAKREVSMSSTGIAITNFYFPQKEAMELLAKYDTENTSTRKLFDYYFRLKQELIGARGGAR